MVMKKIVTIGGGGGHSQVLKALKRIEDIQITGICPSTDSGGSTGVLRDEYDGSSYTGDLTKCLVALSDDEQLSGALLYRYEQGPLHGHSVKNLLFHALEKTSGLEDALERMRRVCGLGMHRVLPVTEQKTELCARLRMGNTISGETNIDTIAKNPLWNPDVHSISRIYLKPQVRASSQVVQAIGEAEYIVVCPGDLYSSIVPVLLPAGVQQAIKKSKAQIILILNIMTKKGETDNYTASDFVEIIERHLGRKAQYIISNSKPIPRSVLLRYSLERKVELGAFRDANHGRIFAVPMAMVTKEHQIYSDPVVLQKTIASILADQGSTTPPSL
jgi:uncharacterized cofD-like protein